MAADFLDVLIFEIAGQRHGLLSADIVELLPALSILPITGNASGMNGVINLRGTIVPVVEVRRSLGLPARPLALSDHFIVVRNGDVQRVLHVDHATELVRLDASALGEVETQVFGRTQTTRVAKLRDGMVVIHAVSDLLAGTDEASA
jgi:purine-binding chemotaxis protein CheW